MDALTHWLQRNSATLIYAVMVTLTAVTFAMGRLGLSGSGVIVIALVIALFKGQLVVDHFMGLRRVRWLWRGVLYGYLAVLGVAIAAAFLLARGSA